MLPALAALLCKDSDSRRAWQEDAATFPMTSLACFGNSEVPQNLVRRSRRLCRAPHVEKSGFSRFLPPLHLLAVWPLGLRLHIGGKQRPDVRETQAALRGPGSLVSAFFVAQFLKSRRCIMLRFFLPVSSGSVTVCLPCSLVSSARPHW